MSPMLTMETHLTVDLFARDNYCSSRIQSPRCRLFRFADPFIHHDKAENLSVTLIPFSDLVSPRPVCAMSPLPLSGRTCYESLTKDIPLTPFTFDRIYSANWEGLPLSDDTDRERNSIEPHIMQPHLYHAVTKLMDNDYRV